MAWLYHRIDSQARLMGSWRPAVHPDAGSTHSGWPGLSVLASLRIVSWTRSCALVSTQVRLFDPLQCHAPRQYSLSGRRRRLRPLLLHADLDRTCCRCRRHLRRPRLETKRCRRGAEVLARHPWPCGCRPARRLNVRYLARRFCIIDLLCTCCCACTLAIFM